MNHLNDLIELLGAAAQQSHTRQTPRILLKPNFKPRPYLKALFKGTLIELTAALGKADPQNLLEVIWQEIVHANKFPPHFFLLPLRKFPSKENQRRISLPTFINQNKITWSPLSTDPEAELLIQPWRVQIILPPQVYNVKRNFTTDLPAK